LAAYVGKDEGGDEREHLQNRRQEKATALGHASSQLISGNLMSTQHQGGRCMYLNDLMTDRDHAELFTRLNGLPAKLPQDIQYINNIQQEIN